MKAVIKHEIKGRMRIHFAMERMSFRMADAVCYRLQESEYIDKASVYECTADAVIYYSCDRDKILTLISRLDPLCEEVPASWYESSSRKLNAEYYNKLVISAAAYYVRKIFFPEPLKIAWTMFQGLKYIYRAVKTVPEKKLKVEMLDAVAITASILVKDYDTASSVMFLLDIGDTLEEWTHKKSVDDLARQMSLNISRVWKLCDGTESLVDCSDVKLGDQVIIRMGNIIPFDGIVLQGEAMVNQSSMTGESIPVHKDDGAAVFAGTVVEEGEITIRVTHATGSGRFDKIVKMIEDSERLKSSVESRAEGLADSLVSYTFAGAALTCLLSRSIMKAISVLMVDYSCALKLTMPISVLSAIREAAGYDITVKGGKFLESVAECDIMVFDKTGTLTKAEPVVKEVVSFSGEEPDELLRQAACLEEHFPHSIANAVVAAAANKGLTHEELHAKVEYIVAHGISSMINGCPAQIGSYHFIFEDEGVLLPEGMREKFESLDKGCSHLYFAKAGKLAAVILIEDPLRENASSVISALHDAGIKKCVMMTGDSERTAAVIADKVGIDEYHAEVLPEDKSAFVSDMKERGQTVLMIGDGINDSPALSAADCGIAISGGAEIAKQIADITIGSDDLHSIVILKQIGDHLMKRIRFNYRAIVGFNTMLIFLGVIGVLPPAMSALMHNTSTLVLGISSTRKLI